MKLLLKDCVRYVPHKYKNEAELEAIIFEHYRVIFGENSLIFPKKKIKTPANIGTIPDAFVVDFKSRRWFIVEVELSRHRIYEHIIPQLTKFLNALKNPNTKNGLADAFYNYIKTDPYKIALLESNGIERAGTGRY